MLSMRLPGLSKDPANDDPVNVVKPKSGGEEFLLMSPLAPVNREGQNILGWMCARCDAGHYGELVLYRFPQKVSVSGPNQIAQLINSDTVISPQLSLLRSGGSTATMGNLLVIPIDTSLLYIAPLYVEATSSAIKLPQLQKVIVAFGQKVAMEDTLDKALADLFPSNGQAPSEPGAVTPPPGSAPHSPAGIQELINRAGSEYQAASERLKAGDFAGYGAKIKEMGATLADLKRAAGSSTPAAQAPKTAPAPVATPGK